MSSKRKEELIEYIQLMRGLLGDGFQCNNELNKAVKELQDIMFPEKPKTPRINIIVIEDTLDGFMRSVDIYSAVTQTTKKSSHVGNGNAAFFNGETAVYIYNAKSINKDNIRGLQANYIVNNATSDVTEILQGIRKV